MEMARQRFQYGLSKVPDDRLNFSIGGKATTPLQIAGKVGMFMGFIAHGVRTGEAADRSRMPPMPETREAAIQAVDRGYAAFQDMLASIGETELRRERPAPWGTPMTGEQWLSFAAVVTGYFQGQLNLVQLAYGDDDPNIPPEWKQPAG
jgi:hypothetical protein